MMIARSPPHDEERLRAVSKPESLQAGELENVLLV